MVARLGEIARERGLARVELPFARTAKNQPAELFLKSLGGAVEEREGGFVVRLPAEEAAALAYVPAEGAAELVADDAPKAPKGEGATRSPEALETIARELGTAAAIHARVAPAARKARPALAAPPLAPRDAREREVAAICEDALGVAPVGVRDDLFLELGADSFAAVRIAAGMREKLGLPVQVVTVQETRTVERLCEATAPRAQVTPSGPTKALHALRREGTKPALFLGRPATRSGGGLSYVALARAIDPDRPVYVFQNRPLLDGTAPYPSIEEMAREYREAIREVQPKGPYLLAGWCLGGKTAREMAHLLTRGGDRVSRLVLFDTPAPSSLRERAAFLAKREVTRAELRAFARFPRLQRVLPWIKIARSRSLLQRFGVLAYYEHDNDDLRLIAYAFPGLFDLGALAALPAAARWQRVYETLAAGEAGGAAPENVDAAAVRRGYHYFAWDHRLDAMYRPAFTYAGRVSMINVRGAPYPAAWRRYLAHDPEVVEIDAKGNKTAPDAHSAMMSEENVKLFGPVLARMLEETA
jgi:acyl carrier protein